MPTSRPRCATHSTNCPDAALSRMMRERMPGFSSASITRAAGRPSFGTPASSGSKALSPSAGLPLQARGSRGLRKVKCLNRKEFVVVGWTDPEGSRPHLGGCSSPITRRTPPRLRRASWHSAQHRPTPFASRQTWTARCRHDAARRAAASHQPLRGGSGPFTRALSPA